MVRFVRYWIERNMEDPVERERRAREHTAKVRERAEQVMKSWNKPGRPKGYWNGPTHAESTKHSVAQAIATPSSEYKAALIEMDEKRIRDAAGKQ